MSVRTQRGRAVRPSRRSSMMKLFYIVLGVIAVAGIALIGYQFLPKSATTAATVSLGSFPSKGQANAPVTVVEYADFQCPSCGQFANSVEPLIDQLYVNTGKVRFIFHDFPLTQHPNAVPAAQAARCASDQGKFWEMHQLLFANQAQWNERAQPLAEFQSYASAAKLDQNTFTQCFNSNKYAAPIQAAASEALSKNIDATPTFMINGQTFTSQTLRAGIDAALAAAGQK